MESTIYCLFIIFPFCLTLPQGSTRQSDDCSSFESQGYFCVPYFLCNKTGHIITDGGVDIIDPRSSEAVLLVDHQTVLMSRCDGLIQVCCQHPDKGKNDEGLEIRPPKPMCGKRNAGGVIDTLLQVEGGELKKGNSELGEWPHVCIVMKEDTVEDRTKINRYQCAGSLVSKQVVLTAAHCVKNAKENNEKITVRCGEWDISNNHQRFPYQERVVTETFIHPNFTHKNLHNDFAILFTDEDFDLDEHISPVCLPSPSDMFKPQDCVSNGWGKDAFGAEGRYQRKLKEINLPLVNNQECQSRLRETRLTSYFELDDSFICAGGERGVDTCKGDGGGPLSCRHDESGPWVQAGIVSWGIGCGDDIPAVYANVAKAACWIDKQVSCHLEKLSIETFSSNTELVQSHFGFTIDECPGKFAPWKCPQENGDNYENYDYTE